MAFPPPSQGSVPRSHPIPVGLATLHPPLHTSYQASPIHQHFIPPPTLRHNGLRPMVQHPQQHIRIVPTILPARLDSHGRPLPPPPPPYRPNAAPTHNHPNYPHQATNNYHFSHHRSSSSSVSSSHQHRQNSYSHQQHPNERDRRQKQVDKAAGVIDDGQGYCIDKTPQSRRRYLMPAPHYCALNHIPIQPGAVSLTKMPNLSNCFNCGGGHMLRSCRLPRDDQCVRLNRQLKDQLEPQNANKRRNNFTNQRYFETATNDSQNNQRNNRNGKKDVKAALQRKIERGKRRKAEENREKERKEKELTYEERLKELKQLSASSTQEMETEKKKEDEEKKKASLEKEDGEVDGEEDDDTSCALEAELRKEHEKKEKDGEIIEEIEKEEEVLIGFKFGDEIECLKVFRTQQDIAEEKLERDKELAAERKESDKMYAQRCKQRHDTERRRYNGGNSGNSGNSGNGSRYNGGRDSRDNRDKRDDDRRRDRSGGGGHLDYGMSRGKRDLRKQGERINEMINDRYKNNDRSSRNQGHRSRDRRHGGSSRDGGSRSRDRDRGRDRNSDGRDRSRDRRTRSSGQRYRHS